MNAKNCEFTKNTPKKIGLQGKEATQQQESDTRTTPAKQQISTIPKTPVVERTPVVQRTLAKQQKPSTTQQTSVAKETPPSKQAWGYQRTPRMQHTPATDRKQKPISNETILNTAFCKSIETPKRPDTIAAAKASLKPTRVITDACQTPSSLLRGRNFAVQLPAAPTPKLTKKLGDSKEDIEMNKLKVVIRVRPLNEEEVKRANILKVVEVNTECTELTVHVNKATVAPLHSKFTFDRVLYSCDPESKLYAGQQEVFEHTARPLIDRAFAGINACLFAYGQTGSGKSYSMMGSDLLDSVAKVEIHADAGIIPRFCSELFKRVEAEKYRMQADIQISYFEIYNEKIYDLFSSLADEQNGALSIENISETATPVVVGKNNNNKNGKAAHTTREALRVREHPQLGPYVSGLKVQTVSTHEALCKWLAFGNLQRATASTAMNVKSSRSHSIFNIMLKLTETGDGGEVRQSKISLVDLAGSERNTNTKESSKINQSLTILGRVMTSLAEDQNFIPYRESLLTFLLKENLGGNSATVMLATVSPANIHIDETLATLRYASQARVITNKVRVNKGPDVELRRLHEEIAKLKAAKTDLEQQLMQSKTLQKSVEESANKSTQIEMLRSHLDAMESQVKRMQKSYLERLRESEDQQKAEMKLLKRKGLALELSTEQNNACLINLCMDPLFSGKLAFVIPPGSVKIGCKSSSPSPSTSPLPSPSSPSPSLEELDIILDGVNEGVHFCTIENEDNGTLFITPAKDDAKIYLNGDLVKERMQMFNGDRLIIAANFFFRVSNPFCTKRSEHMVVDFALAHEEWRRRMEESYQDELRHNQHAEMQLLEADFKLRSEALDMQRMKTEYLNAMLESERKKRRNSKTEVYFNLAQSLTASPYDSPLSRALTQEWTYDGEENMEELEEMLKTATKLCHDMDMAVEFYLTQDIEEGALRFIVLLVDKVRKIKAKWSRSEFRIWFQTIQNLQKKQLSSTELFKIGDIQWQPLTDSTFLQQKQGDGLMCINQDALSEYFVRIPQQQVDEAMTFCHRLGMNVKFQLEPMQNEEQMSYYVVGIWDSDNRCKAVWPMSRFQAWLELVRNAKELNAESIFKLVPTDWRPLSMCETKSKKQQRDDEKRILKDAAAFILQKNNHSNRISSSPPPDKQHLRKCLFKSKEEDIALNKKTARSFNMKTARSINAKTARSELLKIVNALNQQVESEEGDKSDYLALSVEYEEAFKTLKEKCQSNNNNNNVQAIENIENVAPDEILSASTPNPSPKKTRSPLSAFSNRICSRIRKSLGFS